MYNNPYITNTYNPQMTKDRIDNQIAQLQQMKEQLPNQFMPQQPTNLTQNFQLAPNTQNNMKFVETINDVNREIVYTDTPFFSKDMSVLWIKNTKGEIKAYTLAEIIQKDEKDLKIDMLMAQIEELKKGSVINEYENESSNVSKYDTYNANTVESKKPNNGKSNTRNDK